MKVNEIVPLQTTVLPGAEAVRAPRPGETPTFKEIVNKYLEETNQLQLKAGEAVRQMAAGEIDDIHDVMIAVEKSRVSLELVIEIRNRLLEAYRELMRMQV
ncbi:MAG: flagellar hook-basal body complex protein FliE [bacterium]|jgi:flagellar hook-basal body complex protein FliE|nr:flagellar hook-basal body complex protein FliE [candidate division KSB1 bacterium]MDH7559349.1 flagellar hook-basal body complex protein FliE [bacterium]